jgi:hypothetical protein
MVGADDCGGGVGRDARSVGHGVVAGCASRALDVAVRLLVLCGWGLLLQVQAALVLRGLA